MKRTIDNVLLQCERAIVIFNCWIAECNDSWLKLDTFVLADMVLYTQSVCRVYYHHWSTEFTPAQYQRLGRLLSFDVVKHRDEHSRLAPGSLKLFADDDLPF